jgi:hypothetical protein
VEEIGAEAEEEGVVMVWRCWGERGKRCGWLCDLVGFLLGIGAWELRFTLQGETGLIWVAVLGCYLDGWDNKPSVFATARSFIPRVG